MILDLIQDIISNTVKKLYPGLAIKVELEISPSGFGDFSSNIPFKIAKILKRQPILIAEEISENIMSDIFESVEASKPGYINFSVSLSFYKDFINSLEQNKEKYYSKPPNGKKIQVEFVSANPTGPLHIGNGRGGIIGDVLANLLKIQGFKVEKEYYVNDTGNKMDLFANSIFYYYQRECNIESNFPVEGYKGEYIHEIAKEIFLNYGDRFLNIDRIVAIEEIKKNGKEIMIKNIMKSLESFGIKFDKWFYETSLYENGEIEETLDLFKKNRLAYSLENAIWFKSTRFGDDKDRVLVKSNGEPTYTLSDAAYHRNKWKRGFKKVIDIWGADHFGHIVPMKSLIQGLGLSKDFLEIVIYQIVHLFEDGKEVMMSKHTGSFITLDELVNEVGKDAARIFFLLKSANTHLNFDLNLAKSHSMDNPVYYMQYTFARLSNIIKEGHKRGIDYMGIDNIDLKELNEEERNVLNNLIYMEELLSQITIDYSVNKIPFATLELAKKINSFYQKYKVLQSGKLAQKRLSIIYNSLIVLSLLFDIMGIEKREQM